MPPAGSAKETPHVLEVKTLSRFLRATFGQQASAEAHRRQAAWRGSATRDIAEIWGSVAKELIPIQKHSTEER